MTTTTTHDRPASAASAAYLAAVGAALAGVPDSDRQELLDDLAEHLAELVDADSAGLVERLGSPDAYAAELLASAGIEPTPRSGFTRTNLVERARTAGEWFESPTARSVRAFLIECRPGWWVARAWLVLAAIAAQDGLQEALWLPNITGNGLVDLALLAGAVVLSIKIGRGPKWAAWTATAVGVVALFSVATADRTYFYPSYAEPDYYSSPGTLVNSHGEQVTNVFPYDASGKAIAGVFLFDQAGLPLDIGTGHDLQSLGAPFVSGLFPQPELRTNADDTTRVVQPKAPKVVVPRLPAAAKPTAKTKTTVPKAKTPSPSSLP